MLRGCKEPLSGILGLSDDVRQSHHPGFDIESLELELKDSV